MQVADQRAPQLEHSGGQLVAADGANSIVDHDREQLLLVDRETGGAARADIVERLDRGRPLVVALEPEDELDRYRRAGPRALAEPW